MGAGIGYLKHEEYKKLKESHLVRPNFSSVPVYLFLKSSYILLPTWETYPYIKGDLGYSFNFYNDKTRDKTGDKTEDKIWNEIGYGRPMYRFLNGLYFSLGLGLDIGNLGFDVSFKNFSTGINSNLKPVDAGYINEKFNQNSYWITFTYKFI